MMTNIEMLRFVIYSAKMGTPIFVSWCVGGEPHLGQELGWGAPYVEPGCVQELDFKYLRRAEHRVHEVSIHGGERFTSHYGSDTIWHIRNNR